MSNIFEIQIIRKQTWKDHKSESQTEPCDAGSSLLTQRPKSCSENVFLNYASEVLMQRLKLIIPDQRAKLYQ